jgi:hypothetical protein
LHGATRSRFNRALVRGEERTGREERGKKKRGKRGKRGREKGTEAGAATHPRDNPTIYLGVELKPPLVDVRMVLGRLVVNPE